MVSKSSSEPARTASAGSGIALRMDEAIPLASAFADRVARQNGIRALIIKGDTLAYYGLRERMVSTDADILVDPASFADLGRVFEEHGWRRRDVAFRGQWDAPHSMTFVHPSWPCDIDLHRFFPGFLAEPTAAFEALWDRRTRIDFSHQDCNVPDQASSALILALNVLRSGDGATANPAIAQWVAEQSPASRDEFWDLIITTGCEVTLGSLFSSWQFDVPAREGEPTEMRRRLIRGMSGAHGEYFWRVAVRNAGPLDILNGLAQLVASPIVSVVREPGRLNQVARQLRRISRTLFRPCKQSQMGGEPTEP